MKNNEKVIYEIPHIGGILREKGYTSKSYNFSLKALGLIKLLYNLTYSLNSRVVGLGILNNNVYGLWPKK